MKRFLIMCITMVMAVGAVATAEAKQPARSERTVQGSYGPYPAPVTGCNKLLGPWACMIVQTRPTERFVTVKVTDTHGLPVYFTLYGGRGLGAFCGETKTPVAFGPGRDLEIQVGVPGDFLAAARTHCTVGSVKTTGTIRVTLSNQR